MCRCGPAKWLDFRAAEPAFLKAAPGDHSRAHRSVCARVEAQFRVSPLFFTIVVGFVGKGRSRLLCGRAAPFCRHFYAIIKTRSRLGTRLTRRASCLQHSDNNRL
jgi:hypothetical protein